MIGCFLIAVSFNMLLNPNRIASGGVTGLATLLERYLGASPAISIWAINAVLLVVGGLALGRAFMAKSLFGSVLLPLLIYATADWPPLTTNPLLASVYGGIGTGIGLGLLFRVGGSVGGFSVVASLLLKRQAIPPAKTITVLDGLVIAIGGIAFSPENALYALVSLFFIRRLLSLIHHGSNATAFALIVSDRPEPVRDAMLERLDRGMTELRGTGAFTGTDRNVQLVVLKRSEVPLLKRLVAQADPRAFVLLSDAEEVMGEGFDRFEIERRHSRERAARSAWI
ncbi:YitT family protein [Paenibacillus koleovorans]|uniref:YitT family protein n=1 Tax=Paenibacillus koleovorans TaxID=121608 RepID=UPI0013E36B8F|nr:YitT family protein [Paenibacillus koleovorans]